MRPRRKAELASPERIALLSRTLEKSHTPKAIRNYIRNHYVVDCVDELYSIGMGDPVVQLTDREGVPKMGPDGNPIYTAAPIGTRKECLIAVVNFATIGANVHMLGDDNEAMQGAIALPELELRHQQRRLSPVQGGVPIPQGQNLGEGKGVVTNEYTVPVGESHTNGNGNGQHE